MSKVAKQQRIFLKKCPILILLLVVLCSLPNLCASQYNDNPSYKYSREANENLYENEHGHHHEPHGHVHEGHGHSHFHDHKNMKRNIYTADMSKIWLYSTASTLFISAAPFVLLFIIPLDNSDEMKPRLKVLLAFASGGLLGDAFLHLIPHATHPHHIHDHSHNHGSDNSHPNGHTHDHSAETVIGLWVLGGIIAFLTVEKLVRIIKGDENFNHGHSHLSTKKTVPEAKKGNNKDANREKSLKNKKYQKEGKVEISGYLNLAADFAHNFTDGLAIGASFLAGNSIGIVTTVTILLHEVPHEIGDFAILIKSGCSRRKAMLLQLVTALGALAGNVLALIGVGADADAAPWVLPFTAGGFIYIATVSVLPELLEESTKLGQSIKEIFALLAGVLLMAFIAHLE